MADRRMFTKKITDGDAFTSLPPTAQCLYFHLCMSADDDGFSNSIRLALFNAHASTDDFDTLVRKRFIIPFESGVIVIKHWKMHNYIQSDRYHETKYLVEKSQLVLKENNVYTEARNVEVEVQDTPCIQDGYKLEAEVSIGKDSINISSKEDMSHLQCDEEKKGIHQDIVDAWNSLSSVGITPIRKINSGSTRAKSINARIKEYGLDAIFEAIENIRHSDYLQGRRGDVHWFCFDWFIRPNNFPKVLEGKYNNKGSESQKNDKQGKYYEDVI